MRMCGLVVAAAVYGLSAIGPAGANHRVLIPADSPVAVEPPFAVDVLDADGARGIRIPPGTGRGWCNEAKGSATYVFHVPQDGRYVLWGYALWGEACTNAVYVQVDEQPKVVFGNDPVYGTWHWVRGVDYPLCRGTHRIVLSNHSDGIAIRQLLWLSDPGEDPSGNHVASYDIFYDGFDGCDGGNVAAWQCETGKWDIQQAEADTSGDRYLAGTSDGGATFAATGEDGWDDYSIALRMNVRKAGIAGVAFNWQGPHEYMALRWREGEASAAGAPAIELVRVCNGQATVLCSERALLSLGTWHDVELRATEGVLGIVVDGQVAARLPLEGSLQGRAALLVAEGGQAWFDDVHVRKHGQAVQQSATAPASTGGQSCVATKP
jgi:hypothetical protein